MDYSALRLFLSEESINMHLEYLNKQKLLYSILKKSQNSLVSDDIMEVYKQNLPKDVKKDALNLLCNIKSHELFFDSFVCPVPSCKNIAKYYGSAEKLLYELYIMAKESSYGFIYVSIDKSGYPRVDFRNDALDIFLKYMPLIAFDLYEHAYFRDYGFNKDRYLKNSLAYLNLKLLEVCL